MENPTKMDDLGVPLFLETPIYHIQVLSPSHLFFWEPKTTSTNFWLSTGSYHGTPRRVFFGCLEASLNYHPWKKVWKVHKLDKDLMDIYIYICMIQRWVARPQPGLYSARKSVMSLKWATDDYFPDPKWRSNEQQGGGFKHLPDIYYLVFFGILGISFEVIS